MDYVERLTNLGFLRCCAQRIVDDHLDTGREKELREYIATKEHVTEVLG